jgi:putative transposase
MPMLLNYKYEIFPTQEQMELLTYWVNICRQQYNSALLDKNNVYKREKRTLKRSELQSIQTSDKKKHPFLKQVPSQPLQEVFVRLEKSFEKFFRKEAKYPKLKGMKDYTSITFTQFGMDRQNQKSKNGQVKRQLVRRAASLGKNGKLQISGLGLIHVVWHRKLDGKVKQVIVKRQGSRWFAIFTVDRKSAFTPKVDFDQTVGIDVGIKKFAILSNGTEIENPKFLRSKEKQLKRVQQRFSRMKKGSENWLKQLKKVQQIHTKVANQRKDFLHKTSFNLARSYSMICVEELKINQMKRNRKLSKSIHDAGWGMFRSFLAYKCEKNGGILVKVKPHYTSQACSSCGTIVKKSLSVRTHICLSCGLIADRDHNAAKNIETKGLEQVFSIVC